MDIGWYDVCMCIYIASCPHHWYENCKSNCHKNARRPDSEVRNGFEAGVLGGQSSNLDVGIVAEAYLGELHAAVGICAPCDCLSSW